MNPNPAMEPCFIASLHAVELSFILMAEFVKDPRQYVTMRPRIEMMADDLVSQGGDSIT